ncbi:uncharacterized protein N7469_006239 [Penicillium citrinum]|uniref:Uncharacterized protein n=1 Tax=Penicillium citrinum TaxID=5077 RepID=A0A9W9TM78_PENCI|nr:uncharacterized protein N7469_006239 [Penicillium citrinum]KAJ5231651.1 hypothetical protein N7469_006239 [Penicillium citrinum]
MATSVLITGSNRGIGFELLKMYLAQPSTTVIAGVRDVNHPSAVELKTLPVGQGSRLIVIQLDSTSPTDAEAAVSRLQSDFGITKLDTVVANAGIGKYWGLVVDTPAKEVEEHFEVNSLGPFRLFQATQALLFKASTPRFVVISTVLGSVELQKSLKIPNVAYGMSKAAVNFFTAKIHHENPQLIAFPIHPGWVKTELGNSIAVAIGSKEASITLPESAAGIEASTREATSGRFIGYDAASHPW